MAELDPPDFQRQAAGLLLAHARAQDALPRFIQLPNHNHLSTVLQLNTPVGRDFEAELLRFIGDRE